MKRRVWERVAAIYDTYVTNSEDEFLQAFMKEEQDLLDALILQFVSPSSKVSLLEVGCGTGRTLFWYAQHRRMLDDIEYLIGIDNATAMWNIARFKKIELQKSGILSESEARKYWFLLMPGERLSRYFRAGSIRSARLVKDFGNASSQGHVDEEIYGNSIKIVCTLLNTVGVLDRESRTAVLQNMMRALGPRDMMVVSVFAAESFAENARELYASLPFVGLFDRAAFDDSTHEFKTSTYYSRWFTKSDTRKLLTDLGCVNVHVQTMASGGHFATARSPLGRSDRQPKKPD
jgi:SAM-dependent methyltransferase